ncbi:MAG: discoidin domain-containing protein [Sarcina sp.]
MRNNRRKIAALIATALTTSMMVNYEKPITVKASNDGKVNVEVSENVVTIGNGFISRTFSIENNRVKTSELDNKRAGVTYNPAEGSEEFVVNTLSEKATNWKVIDSSSQEISSENGGAQNAIDGDSSTIWHTKYGGGEDPYPHYITIDLGEEKNLEGFSYLPRQSGNNGDIKDYEFYVSNDRENFGEPVSTGTFSYDGKKEIRVNFDAPTTGRYIKLVGINSVNGANFAACAELDVMEVGENNKEKTEINTSDLTLNAVNVEESANNNGKKIEFDFAPFQFKGANWDIDMNVVMEDGDHFMRKYLEISVDDPKATIDYIDLEHLILDHTVTQSWSRPDMEPAFISGYHIALGQPVYIDGMFFGSEFPSTDNRIVDVNGKDLAHIKYFSGKEFEDLKKTTDGKFVTWQTVAGAARSTEQSVIQSDFFKYIDTISTRTDFRKQYNSWYDHMMNITAENIEGSFYEIEKGLSQNGVEPVDSYVVDDGWNDYNGDFWSFNNKFPNELYDSTALTDKFSSNFGLWLGPRGGYNYPSQFGRQMEAAGTGGFNTASQDVCTGHPTYLNSLTDLFKDYMKKFDINYWKFDGFNLSPCPVKTHGHITGGPNGMYFTTEHWENWIDVFNDIREARKAEGKDLFINMTCYSTPSPWFLQWVNTIWLQNSNDVGFIGGEIDGSMMDAMLTYRDDRYFDFVGTRQFQFPLANVYNHDPIYGNTNVHNGKTVTMNTDQFEKYLYMLMTRGTAFWELYYSYNLMDDEKWMVNSELLKWGEENFHILRNAKLIGETPKNGHVYGYSSWDGDEGIVSLRNPSNEKKTFALTLDRLIGVGESAANLSKTTVYPYGVLEDTTKYNYGDTITVELEPHEVAIWQFGEGDNTAAEVVNVESSEGNKVRVEFNERILGDKANYSMEDNTIVNAKVLADHRTVELELENALTDGDEYNLNINGVSDLGRNITNTTESFNFYGENKVIEVNGADDIKGVIIEEAGVTPNVKALMLENKSYELNDTNSIKGVSDFGVSMLVKTTDTNGTLLCQGDEYSLKINGEGKLEFSSKGVTVTSNATVNNNAWNNVTALREKNGMVKLYINGALDSSSYDETKSSEYVATAPITLGSVDFTASVSNVVVRNTALGFDEVKADAESIPTGAYTIKPYKSTTIKGVLPNLPTKVTLEYENGAKLEADVTWEALNMDDFNTAGEVTVQGIITGIEEKAVATIKVLDSIPNDEFNSSELNGIWSIEREVNDKWSLTENEGKLTIHGTAGYNDGNDRNDNDNIFLQERYSEDYVITTKLEGKPSRAYQSAGLLSYIDNNNYVRIARKNVGNNILSFTYETNGGPKHIEIADPVPGEDIYLALQKEGDMYSSYYSVDGVEWKVINEPVKVNIGDNHKVGLYVTNGTGPQYTAKFDHFRYLPYSPTTSVESIGNVAITTEVKVAPVMPAKVTLNLADGSTKNAIVKWDAISEDLYANVGTFEVKGIVEGTDLEVTATVTVEGGEVIPPTGEKPNKVGNLRVTDTTSHSITIDWEAPTNTTIKDYVIFKDGMEIGRTTDTNYTVDGLKANTLYGFKVVAVSTDMQLSRPVAKNGRTEKVKGAKGFISSVIEKIFK